MKKIIASFFAIIATLVIGLLFSFSTSSPVAGAVAAQVCPDSNGWVKVEGNQSGGYTAPSGFVVDAVCVKGGNDVSDNGYYFTTPPSSNTVTCEKNDHSGSITVNGVGTSNITYTIEGDGCAEISHASYHLVSTSITTITPSLSPSTTPSTTPSVTPEDKDKVTICHATDAVNNPYVRLTVDADSADGDTANDNGQGDHSEHTGPVATSEAVAQQLKDLKTAWGDIIPAHDNYAGLNWDATGQAVYNNNCNYATVPTPTPTPETGRGGGGSDNPSSNVSPSNNSTSTTPSGSVLAANTMAGTGTFETTMMNAMLGFGMMFLGLGSKLYARSKNV